MGSVTPANNSKFLNRQNHEIYAVKEENDSSDDQLASDRASISSMDNLDLSPATRQLFTETEQSIRQLIEEFPNCKHYFNDNITGIALLSNARTWLQNPIIHKQAQYDTNLSTFYFQMKRILSHHVHALAQVQQKVQTEESPSYHHVLRNNRL